MIDGVVFDLEGTLVRLPIDYESLYGEISRVLKISKVKPLTHTIRTLDDEARRKFYELWKHAEFKALQKMSANEEGMKIYRRRSNKPVALVTLQGKAVVRKILDHFHLTFNVVITREDEIGRAQQIRKALDALGSLEPRNVLVIGDRDSDEAAAKQVGCRFVKVKK
jgi:phosphoglycolate phosphatase